jgi:hypothetical protein
MAGNIAKPATSDSPLARSAYERAYVKSIGNFDLFENDQMKILPAATGVGVTITNTQPLYYTPVAATLDVGRQPDQHRQPHAAYLDRCHQRHGQGRRRLHLRRQLWRQLGSSRLQGRHEPAQDLPHHPDRDGRRRHRNRSHRAADHLGHRRHAR